MVSKTEQKRVHNYVYTQLYDTENFGFLQGTGPCSWWIWRESFGLRWSWIEPIWCHHKGSQVSPTLVLYPILTFLFQIIYMVLWYRTVQRHLQTFSPLEGWLLCCCCDNYPYPWLFGVQGSVLCQTHPSWAEANVKPRSPNPILNGSDSGLIFQHS